MQLNEKNEEIEDYNVLSEPLGTGGFATVYKAVSKRTKQEFAIKTVTTTKTHRRNFRQYINIIIFMFSFLKIEKRKLTRREDLVKRIKDEVRIHIRLKHPSILELYTLIENKDYVYLVLQLAKNGEFGAYLKSKGRLDENETRHYMHQIVSGLLYLQKHNVMHRDLTLSNLLLDEDYNVVSSLFYH